MSLERRGLKWLHIQYEWLISLSHHNTFWKQKQSSETHWKCPSSSENSLVHPITIRFMPFPFTSHYATNPYTDDACRSGIEPWIIIVTCILVKSFYTQVLIKTSRLSFWCDNHIHFALLAFCLLHTIPKQYAEIQRLQCILSLSTIKAHNSLQSDHINLCPLWTNVHESDCGKCHSVNKSQSLK